MRRMAGTALKWLTKDIKPAELGVRVGMDALGGLMAAAYTPGDLGDKLIAGTATTLGGATGGLALGRLGGPGIGGTALDFVGSVGGDILGSMLGEQVIKEISYPRRRLPITMKNLAKSNSRSLLNKLKLMYSVKRDEQFGALCIMQMHTPDKELANDWRRVQDMLKRASRL